MSRKQLTERREITLKQEDIITTMDVTIHPAEKPNGVIRTQGFTISVKSWVKDDEGNYIPTIRQRPASPLNDKTPKNSIAHHPKKLLTHADGRKPYPTEYGSIRIRKKISVNLLKELLKKYPGYGGGKLLAADLKIAAGTASRMLDGKRTSVPAGEWRRLRQLVKE